MPENLQAYLWDKPCRRDFSPLLFFPGSQATIASMDRYSLNQLMLIDFVPSRPRARVQQCHLYIPEYPALVVCLVFLVLFVCGHCLADDKILRVEDFGAVADGKTDCTEAFKKAIALANKTGPGVTVRLGQGRYVISSELPGKAAGGQDTSGLEGKAKEEYDLCKQVNKFKVPACIKLDGIKGVTLTGVGQQTEVVVNGPMAGAFDLLNCTAIHMRDFCVDYDPIPFTQGTIIGIDENAGTFDYKIDADFPQLSEYWFDKCDSKWGVPFDNQRRFRQGGLSAIFCKNWEERGDSVWRMNLNYPNQAKGLRIGDRYIHIARTHNSVITFNQCTDIFLDNLSIYASPSASTFFLRCEGTVHINGLQTRARPGSKRILGPNADGVHCQSLRKGPVIENCIFEAMADDAMNIYAPPSVITEVIDPNRIRVSNPHVLRKGDYVQIIRPSEGVILEESVEVAAVDNNIITLKNTVSGLKAGKNHVDADTLYNLSACGNGFIVRNNVIGGFRGRGILARGQDGLIENNLIHDTSGQGISICNEPDWPEGPIPAHVTIRNNTLVGVCRDSNQMNGAAIQVSAYKLGYTVAQQAVSTRPVIENNRIVDSPGHAILLQGVSGAKVNNNMVQQTANDRPLEAYYGITLQNCKDISIDGFVMIDSLARIRAGILLEGTSRDEVKTCHIYADVPENGLVIAENRTEK